MLRVHLTVWWVDFDMLQVSALEQDIIEVDPETKEMLKHLVNKLAVSIFL